jgi:hypothetical protein
VESASSSLVSAALPHVCVHCAHAVCCVHALGAMTNFRILITSYNGSKPKASSRIPSARSSGFQR